MFLLKTAMNIYTYTVFPFASIKSIYILLGQFFIYRTYLSRQYYSFLFFFNWISLLQIRITSQESLDLFHSQEYFWNRI